MGAKTGLSNANKNFYGIADGMLVENRSEPLEGFEEISEETLKKARSSMTSIDLRGKYVKRDSEKYRYRHYLSHITGKFIGVEKKEVKSYGSFLSLTIIDEDNEVSEITTKFYGKYSENLMNRLISTDLDVAFTLTPYSVPSEYQIPKGELVKFYNQGVSVHQSFIDKGDVKVEAYYNHENGLPSTERVKNPSDGSMITSRVSRIDFLWNALLEKVNISQEPEMIVEDDEEDDLPF